MSDGCFQLCTPNKRKSSDSSFPPSRVQSLRAQFTQGRSTSDPSSCCHLKDLYSKNVKSEDRDSISDWKNNLLSDTRLLNSRFQEVSETISLICHSHFPFPNYELVDGEEDQSSSLNTTEEKAKSNRIKKEDVSLESHERKELISTGRNTPTTTSGTMMKEVGEKEEEEEYEKKEQLKNSQKKVEVSSSAPNERLTVDTPDQKSSSSFRTRPKKSPLLRIVSVPDQTERIEIRDLYSSSRTRELASNVLQPQRKMTKHWSMDETQNWFYSRNVQGFS